MFGSYLLNFANSSHTPPFSSQPALCTPHLFTASKTTSCCLNILVRVVSYQNVASITVGYTLRENHLSLFQTNITNSSMAGRGLCAQLHSPWLNGSGLDLLKHYACCHNHCGFTRRISPVSRRQYFLVVMYLFWLSLLPSSLPQWSLNLDEVGCCCRKMKVWAYIEADSILSSVWKHIQEPRHMPRKCFAALLVTKQKSCFALIEVLKSYEQA